MLRTATNRGVNKIGRVAHQSIRRNASDLSKQKGSLPKKLFLITGVTAGVSGGIIAYAYYDPVLRGKIEKAMPFTKDFFQYVDDKKSSAIETIKHRTAEIKTKFGDILPIRKAKEPFTEESEKSLLRLEFKESVTDKEEEKGEPLLRLRAPLEAESSPRAAVVVDPVDLKTPIFNGNSPVTLESDIKAKRNRELESSLKASLISSESRVRLATEAKLATIDAINQHAALLKEAVSSAQKADWEKVSEAVGKIDKANRNDLAEENDARNYLDNVRKIINEGKQDKMTRYNPLLVNALETVNKLDQQLDELKLAVRKSRDNSRRINQFRDLIERSRRVYADELKDLLPGIDEKARDGALTEDELNMLVAHAHLKVMQLRQKIADQQALEENNIAKAVEEQRIADALSAEEELRFELKRLKDQFDVDFERKLIANRKEWAEEMEERLRNLSAIHSDHLEQVVRTQRQLCDIEQAQKIEEAVAAERKWNNKQIVAAQSKLEGIETALNSRLAADIENRRSKQFWIACQNLIDSVVHGRKGGLSAVERRTPLSYELKVIKEASAGDEYVHLVIDAFSEESVNDGVFPEQDLKTRFAYLYKVARRVAKIDDNGGGIMQYFISYLQNAVTFDLPHSYTSEDKIDPNTIDTYEILSRTKYFVEEGDLTSAVRMAQLLKGEPGRLARDWIKDTRAYLETRFLVELLIAHAAVLSIRTTY